MNICENIKMIRKIKGITQQELSKIINKSAITVKKYESGDIIPPIDTLEKISRELNVDLDVLIHGKDILQENLSVFNFLERILGSDNFENKLDYIFGFKLNFIDNDSLSFHKYVIEDYDNPKIYYLKISELLNLNEKQLYNWVFFDKSIDFVCDKLYEKITLKTQDDADLLMLILNSILLSNLSSFEIQNLDELFENGLSDKNKELLKKYIYKFYDNFKDISYKLKSKYIDFNQDVFKNLNKYLNLWIEISNLFEKNALIESLSPNQIDDISKKVIELIEFEIYKIEKENQNNEKKE